MNISRFQTQVKIQCESMNSASLSSNKEIILKIHALNLARINYTCLFSKKLPLYNF